MKKQMLNRIMKTVLIMAMAMLVVVACKKDDDTDTPGPTPVEDGTYVTGAATGVATPGIKGLMKIARNEVLQEDRAELKEIYMAVKAGADGFNIVTVSGSTTKTWGPGADFAEIPAGELDNDEPKMGLWKGSLVETTDKFTVPTDGLYHIAFDEELMVVVMAKAEWGLIGAATPGGWTDDTPLPASFDLNKMTFEVPEVVMAENTYKFRYSGGWKIILDADYDLGDGKVGIKVNCNFGGAVDALVAGGADIQHDNYAVYKATMVWDINSGHSASMEYVKDAEPLPEYPDTMYIVGAGTAYGWDTPGTHLDAMMHKCAGGVPAEGIFWKICFLEAGQGFKVSDAGWGMYNYGFAEIEEYDAEGVAVTDNGGNMDIATSGMYIVVLNLRDDMIKLSIKEAEVYGIGDAFPTTPAWNEDDPANLFTIDNTAKTLTSPALGADGNIRCYAQHNWIPDWWNAEFNVFSGVIEYRNDGGDQDPVPGTSGQVVTLMFDDNTGDIQ